MDKDLFEIACKKVFDKVFIESRGQLNNINSKLLYNEEVKAMYYALLKLKSELKTMEMV